MKKLILASQSPHRKAIMEKLGFSFETQSPDVDERKLESQFTGELPQLAEFLSVAKAESVAKNFPESVVIGSDQVLLFKGQSFAKPETPEEAILRLQLLQGQTHELHTGLCVIKGSEKQTGTVVAKMNMRPLSSNEIENYVKLDQPMGCAGGYKIESLGTHLFREVETTDHDSIVGLPSLSLVSILRDWGISRL